MRPLTWLLLASTLVACAKKRDPAPTELQDLAEFLFLNWEDDEITAEAIDNLGVWIDANVDSEQAEDGFELEDLSPEDIASVKHPDRPLEGLLGACGSARSAFPIEDHATYIPLSDQTFSNPGTYTFYDRNLAEGTSAAFLDGALLRTVNDIETSSLGVTIPYTLKKDYKWVDTGIERVIFARSWVEERSCNKDGEGGNCLEHSYSIDMFYSDGDDASQRLTATWSEVDTSISLPDATLVATLAIGIRNVFYATEEFLANGGETPE